MALQLPTAGIPQCELISKRNEMADTWRKKYRKAKLEDEKFVMKKATERIGNCKLNNNNKASTYVTLSPR